MYAAREAIKELLADYKITCLIASNERYSSILPGYTIDIQTYAYLTKSLEFFSHSILQSASIEFKSICRRKVNQKTDGSQCEIFTPNYIFY